MRVKDAFLLILIFSALYIHKPLVVEASESDSHDRLIEEGITENVKVEATYDNKETDTEMKEDEDLKLGEELDEDLDEELDGEEEQGNKEEQGDEEVLGNDEELGVDEEESSADNPKLDEETNDHIDYEEDSDVENELDPSHDDEPNKTPENVNDDQVQDKNSSNFEPQTQKINNVEDISYQDGASGDHIVVLKKKLTKLGIGNYPDNPSDYFGDSTENNVREFQSYYGLEVTGVADRSTLKKIEEILNSRYQDGERGDHIVELKQNLTKLGIGNYPKKPSNYFGDATENNVKEFQSLHGLLVSGIAEEKTLELIDKILSPPYQSGDSHGNIPELKKKLTRLGIGNYPDNPSNNFGGSTKRNVKAFQSYYGLEPTGIVDQATLEMINKILSSSYQDGKRGGHVVELKKNLTKLGIGNYPKNPSNYFGDSTENNVKEFQSLHGLLVSGIADHKTLELIDKILSPPYQSGDSHGNIPELKKKLTRLGIGNYPDNPSNNFGGSTKRNVQAFQSYYGLEPTGIADQATLKMIDKILSSSYQDGKRGDHVVELKNNLTRLGIGNYPKNPSNYFGDSTENNVKSFQAYYGLLVNGIADEKTLEKMDEILSSSFQDGERGDHIVELKKNLTRLGIGNYPDNPSNYFGDSTENNVKSFQSYYGLLVSGIADEITLKKIDEVLNSPYQDGKRGTHVVELKKNLRKLGIGNYPANPSNYFGDSTENNVKEFQSLHGLFVSGIADEITVAKIDEEVKKLQITNIYTKYNLTLEEALEIQMKVRPQTDRRYAYVSANYIDKNNKVTANTLNVRSGPSTSTYIVGKLSEGDEVEVISRHNDWIVIKFNGNRQWVDARPEDVLYYLDPNNFVNDSKQKFQFLDLSRASGASETDLNKYLENKGILEGQAKAFIDAAAIHGINDIYLISHASLETGNGKSQLANGVSVGKDSSGKIVLVNSKNKKSLKNIKTVYNMYGIGAYDNCALECGAKRAYEKGWTTPEKAIVGGAEFIGNGYIKSGQNTLYKMRWNPLFMEKEGYASHQYATDIGWASKQINTMYNLYNEIGYFNPYLDIPVYK